MVGKPPSAYFSVLQAVSLNSFPSGARIHVIGVCGVAMGQLAVALVERGFQVSGSDKEFYEPTASLLRSSSVKTCQGYAAENIPADVAVVVIGNAVSADNPEVLAVESRKLPYTLFPKALYETVIQGKHSIVLAGTHGKSTTTAMTAVALREAGLDPSYFVGGAMLDLPRSLNAGKGQFSAVEGDEYDSAFFAKVPKFNFYSPDTLVISSIEYDHADIYPSLDHIDQVFQSIAHTLTSSQNLVYCFDEQHLRELVSRWRGTLKCKVVSYGFDAQADMRITGCSQSGRAQKLTVQSSRGSSFELTLNVPGQHNARNALAVLTAAELNNLPLDKIASGLSNFRGVKRRQEVRFDSGGITVVEDFAHHPTAVRETIMAVKNAYPDRKFVAVFEPRSNTSRRAVFQDAYVNAFLNADRVLLREVVAKSMDEGQALLSVQELAAQIAKKGVAAEAIKEVKEIAAQVVKGARQGEAQVILVMSNGSFDGLIELLISGLKNT